jgi:hypothetical protein
MYCIDTSALVDGWTRYYLLNFPSFEGGAGYWARLTLLRRSLRLGLRLPLLGYIGQGCRRSLQQGADGGLEFGFGDFEGVHDSIIPLVDLAFALSAY